MSHRHAKVHFLDNLKRVKQATISWANEKKHRDDRQLGEVERQIQAMQEGDGEGFNSPAEKEELIRLEKWRTLLEEKEATWHLQNRAIWLSCGDENTKFFQAFAQGRRMANTIWQLKNQADDAINSFEALANLGVENFRNLFKA